jgi:hypothetical protein
MTKPILTLGGRLSLADPATLTGVQRQLFEALEPHRCGAPTKRSSPNGHARHGRPCDGCDWPVLPCYWGD